MISSKLEEQEKQYKEGKELNPEQVEDSTEAKRSQNVTKLMQVYASTQELTKSFQWDY